MKADAQGLSGGLAMPPRSLDGPVAPDGVAYVPAEAVLLLAVAMPDMSPAQRRAAVAFAVEDQIAQPLDAVEVILGPELPLTDAGRRWLVAVIARDVAAGLPVLRKTRRLPDVLALPVPAPGQWAVWAGQARVLVRTADGAGFATTLAALPTYHMAAGRPGITLYGGTLDAGLPVVQHSPLPTRPDLMLDRFTLATDREAARGLTLPRIWRQMAAVLAFAAVGHTGLLAVDTWALGHIRAASEASVRDTLGQMGMPLGADTDTAITAALSRIGGAGGPQFVPVMTRVFAALGPQTGTVTVRDLRYDTAPDRVTLMLEAPDLATLQAVETALNDAGFAVAAGAATTGDGLAEQQLTLQGGGA
jgi:general secretion pathway protein L